MTGAQALLGPSATASFALDPDSRPSWRVPAAGGSAPAGRSLAELADRYELRTTAWALQAGYRRAKRVACLHSLRGGRCDGMACAGCFANRWWSPATAAAWFRSKRGPVELLTMERWWSESAALDGELVADALIFGVDVRVVDDRIELRA